MAVEFTAPATQTVAYGQNVLFTDEPIKCKKGYVIHRDGSGIVTLRGIVKNDGCGCNRFARYLVSFSGNIATALGGTVGEISVGIAVNGEALPATIMRATPAAVGEFFNVSKSTFIDVPKCCCTNISIKNTSVNLLGTTIPIDVANANLIIERVA